MSTVTLAVFLVGALLVLAVALVVAAPLFGPVESFAAEDEPAERARWGRQKRQALSAIKEVELDYQMGKLSDEDLAKMRGRFEAQALEAMVALERKGE